MDLGLPVIIALGGIVVVAVVVALRLRRGRERVVGGDDDPVQRAGGLAAPPASPVAADAPDPPSGKPPLAGPRLEELADSRLLRKMVARAYESGKQDEAVQAIVRLTGVSATEARAFIDQMRQRGPGED
ncbi:MAG: hypothetical protein KIT36_09020 [Alphaproteobacteria bacterium]|nr:hypothetical protein [Alphaproteobacteria bacterium]